MTWIKAARRILERHQYEMIDPKTGESLTYRDAELAAALEEEREPNERKNPKGGVLLDATTASMLCAVHDALNEQHRAKFESLPLLKAVNVGWKCINLGRK